MNKIAIVNHFGKRKIDYKKILTDGNYDVDFYTNKGYSKQFNKDFINLYEYEDYKEDESLYYDLINMSSEKKYERIIATSEFDLEKTAEIREYLGIEGQSYTSAIHFRNKYIMKNCLKGIVNLPEYSLVNSVIDVKEFVEKNGYPIILKPTSGAGSMGVKKIDNEKELIKYLKIQLPNDLMIESFVEGEVCHVDGLYENGKLHLAIPSKYINGCLAFHDNDYVGSFNLNHNSELSSLLNIEVKKVLDSLPTPDHTIAFHAEFFVDTNMKITFCEIGSRVGGGMIVEALKLVTGVNILEESVKADLDIAIKNDYQKDESIVAGCILIPPENKVLKSIKISKEEWVKDVLFKEEFIGKKFDAASNSVDFVVAYLVEGENEDEIISRIKYLGEWQSKNIRWEQI